MAAFYHKTEEDLPMGLFQVLQLSSIDVYRAELQHQKQTYGQMWQEEERRRRSQSLASEPVLHIFARSQGRE